MPATTESGSKGTVVCVHPFPTGADIENHENDKGHYLLRSYPYIDGDDLEIIQEEMQKNVQAWQALGEHDWLYCVHLDDAISWRLTDDVFANQHCPQHGKGGVRVTPCWNIAHLRGGVDCLYTLPLTMEDSKMLI